MKKRVYYIISMTKGIVTITECLWMAKLCAVQLAQESVYPIIIESYNKKLTKEYPKERMVIAGIASSSHKDKPLVVS